MALCTFYCTQSSLLMTLLSLFMQIPIRNIEYVEIRDLLELTVYTKDGTFARLLSFCFLCAFFILLVFNCHK